MKRILKAVAAAAALIAVSYGTCFALNPSSNYTITTSKLKTDGTLATIETVAAQSDANGKLSFTLTTLPTNAEVNFISFTIKDGAGSVVRQGVAPAPPDGDVNKLGINDLSTVQAATFLKAAELAGTDDPILAAYLLVLLRSPDLQAGDVLKLANLGKTAIVGSGGFEGYMVNNGVSGAKMTALKKCLIYNPDPAKATLRDFTKGFFTAVESTNTSTENSETQKAGGLMADVFMNAAACADIELDHITNAHEAAGAAADTTGLMSGGPEGLSATLLSSIDQSMTTFNRKIGMVKMVTDYSNALNTLEASGAQVSTFITAAQAMANTTGNIDVQYADFFRDPITYVANHPGTDIQTVQQAINTIFQNSWFTFQSAIAANNTEISDLRASVTSAFPGIQLPPDFGVNYFGQAPTNWPIQQVVMVNWMINLIKNGGSISYTRDTTPIPNNMQQWLGTCSNTQYWNQGDCTNNGGTWSSQRNTFNTPSAAFNAYLGIQQDVQIADMTRSSIWDNNNQPTQDQRMQSASNFITTLASIENNINATKAGDVPATSAEKKAIIKLMLQPNAN